MNNATPVLVTAVGGRSVGHQILQAVELAEGRYAPVVTDAMAFSYGLYDTQRHYLLPPANSADYIAAVQRIIGREKIAAVLPGSQPETEVLAEHREKLGVPVIANPVSVIRLCKNKAVMQRWLEENGIDVPRSVGGREWKKLAASCGFPLIAKPTQDTGGSRGVAILKDEEEIRMYLAGANPDQVIFQEYVGSAEGEYTVGVMVSSDGKIIDSIVMHRRLVGLSLGTHRIIDGKPYSLSTGYSQGTIVRHPLIQGACEQLALKLGARGPLNIQLRLAGEKVVVFEVHARFSGTSSIRAQVGFNEADTLIRNFVQGEQMGRLDYRTDVAAIRALCSVIVPASQMAGVKPA